MAHISNSIEAALRSRSEATRTAMHRRVIASNDTADVRVLVSLLQDRYGFVVKQALELLAARPDPMAIDALKQFDEADQRFDLVWLARRGLAVNRGEAPPGVPGVADRQAAYGPAIVFESLTWGLRNSRNFPAARGDFATVVLPSFHTEMMVTIGPDTACVWTGHKSIWQSINAGFGFPDGASVCVLTADSNEMSQLRRLASEGFDAPLTPGLDGVSFGRLHFDDERPKWTTWQNPELLEFLKLVRTLGVRASEHYIDFESFESLGDYVDVELETSWLDTPLRATRLSGRCNFESWAEFEKLHGDRQLDVVDVSALGFLGPSVQSAFAHWVTRSGALLVADEANPYTQIASLMDRTYSSWHEAGGGLSAPPVLQSIGYWGQPDADDGLPNPMDFVHRNQEPGARASIADLLDEGVTYVYCMGLSPCRICGKSNGSNEMTNGVVTWPSGLSHYVREHDVALPKPVTDLLKAHPLKREHRWLTMLAAEACTQSDDWWRSATNRK